MLPVKFFEYIQKVEGGYVNNPLDRGGPTKWGVTLKTLSAFRKMECTDKDVEELGPMECGAIYEELYYTPLRLDLIKSEAVKLALFDQGVLWGPARAMKKMLESLAGQPNHSALNFYDLVNSIDAKVVCRKFIQRVQDDFVSSCTSGKSPLIFLKGWINRTHILWDTIEEKI